MSRDDIGALVLESIQFLLNEHSLHGPQISRASTNSLLANLNDAVAAQKSRQEEAGKIEAEWVARQAKSNQAGQASPGISPGAAPAAVSGSVPPKPQQ